MDTLHLSYHQTVYDIPYRTMCLMQMDKQHESFGEVVHKVSGKEMAARRNRKKK